VTFLEAVNRMLRINKVIKGDDDNIASFTETQHAAGVSIAQIAVQAELDDLVSDKIIAFEKTFGTIVTVDATRSYALPSNFVRLYGEDPFLYDATSKVDIYEYPGGVDALRHEFPEYKTQVGAPQWWYIDPTTTKQISLFYIPDTVNAGKTWAFDYEKDVSVVNASDTLPFHTRVEGEAFAEAAAIRMRYNGKDLELEADPLWNSARIRLINLMKYRNPPARYGYSYSS
jgi:hypothetical protein